MLLLFTKFAYVILHLISFGTGWQCHQRCSVFCFNRVHWFQALVEFIVIFISIYIYSRAGGRHTFIYWYIDKKNMQKGPLCYCDQCEPWIRQHTIRCLTVTSCLKNLNDDGWVWITLSMIILLPSKIGDTLIQECYILSNWLDLLKVCPDGTEV